MSHGINLKMLNIQQIMTNSENTLSIKRFHIVIFDTPPLRNRINPNQSEILTTLSGRMDIKAIRE
jgi:hypothetical protein